MFVSPEHRIRQVLNLIWLTERCMRLAGTNPAERAQWAAQLEGARRELALIDPGPDLPEDLAHALVLEREPASAGAMAGASGASSAAGRSTFRGAAHPGTRARHSYRTGH